MLKPSDLYEVTNSGLDIIKMYFPEADPRKKFKMHTENTASASLKLSKGVYYATDFGDEAQSLSPIDICMREEKFTFSKALYFLAGKFNLAPEINPTKNLPGIKQRDPLPGEEDNQSDYELNDEFTKDELKILGPNVTNEHCKKLHYHSVKWISKVKPAFEKDGKQTPRRVTITSSNENYPIFLRDCGEFQKIYQPLNPLKEFRFYSIGNKPANFINGLAELKAAYHEYNAVLQKDFYANPLNVDETCPEKKLDEAVICSGERDALNCASFGYYPIWFNSETYKLSPAEYNEIKKYVKQVYNIPDIDNTGKQKAAELGLSFIDIHTVWLPEWIKEFNDSRLRPRKDLRDFVELEPSIQKFKELLTSGKPAQFWEWKDTQFGRRLELNSIYLIHFLRLHGFYKMKFVASKEGEILIYIKNNIVEQVTESFIKDFIKKWLEDNYYPIEVQNLVINSKKIVEALKRLDYCTLDFEDFDFAFQYLFFKNNAVKITATEIKTESYKGLLKHVWEPLVVKNNFERTAPAFATTWNPERKQYDIEILSQKSKYFNFLINASRIHWRKELETELDKLPADQQEEYRINHKFDIAGPLLSVLDQEEQKLHLLSKIFSIGYLLHSWKAKHRSWCVFAMDNRISEEGSSNGRSGKTFCYMTLQKFRISAYISGRNEKVTDNKHYLEEVTELTRLLIINDAHKYFPFSTFYDMVTEVMQVNPKFGKQFTLPFEQAPKIAITTNYASRNLDDSTQARLLYSVFSDYYHEKTDNNDFRETRKIYDDFNQELHSRTYSADDWNADFNFFAECLQFYISTIEPNRKINPPMDNVMRRNLREGIGDTFKDWADSYFMSTGNRDFPEGRNVNTLIERWKVQDEYLKVNKRDNAAGFMRKLKMWCMYTTWIKELNPKILHNTKDGRIIKKGTNDKGIEGTPQEMIYIQTIDSELKPDYSQLQQPIPEANQPIKYPNNQDDLPPIS